MNYLGNTVSQSEKKTDCYFCEMKRKNDNISKELLFPFIKYNGEGKLYSFQCLICTNSKLKFQKRCELFTHIKSIHSNELQTVRVGNNSEVKPDCGSNSCKKLYGVLEGKKCWCQNCTELSDKEAKAKEEMPKPKNHVKEDSKLCPECGKTFSAGNLLTHLKNKHHGVKQVCQHCAKEYPNEKSLKEHIKKVHIKVPCAQCGELVGSSIMGLHIRSKHTPCDEMKYNCDICGKGFVNRGNFKDHTNTHTGEKPYKCKFCSSCFASRGTHAMHERSHLGHKRSK